MGFLNSIMGAITNPATLMQLAAGPAGWASLAMRTIGSAIMNQVIQQLGQKLGLPPAVINMAQQAFSAASGTGDLGQQTVAQAVSNFAKEANLSPIQEGKLQQAANKTVDNVNKIVEQMMKKLQSSDEGEDAGGGSVLMRIARALGKLMDQKMDSLAAKADQLGRVGGEKGMTNKEGGFNAQGQSKFGQLSAEVQALSQEIGYLSQAISSTIKSIGEAASAIARK